VSGDHDNPHGHEHHDDHGHSHEHEHVGGVRGVLQAIFRPHSHDSADSVDTALESDERGVRAVKISFAGLAVTAIFQVVVVVLTGSVALLADTIHNFSDALTAIPLFIAFRLGRRPATRRYTFGYRRAEDLAGLFVLAMITLSALVAAYEAIDRLINPRSLDHIGALFAAGIVGFLGNELVALYRIREGNAIGSAALVADGYHARTDGFTSLAVAFGAVGVWAGFDRADPIVGLIISVAIFVVLIGAARQVFYRLMDAVDPAVVEEIEHTASHVPGVRRVSAVQVRWLGHRLSASLDVQVDPSGTVGDGHAIAAETTHRLLHDVRHLDDVHVHVDPAGVEHDHRHTHVSAE
jgi:cation diffusion facilitator family transporter